MLSGWPGKCLQPSPRSCRTELPFSGRPKKSQGGLHGANARPPSPRSPDQSPLGGATDEYRCGRNACGRTDRPGLGLRARAARPRVRGGAHGAQRPGRPAAGSDRPLPWRRTTSSRRSRSRAGRISRSRSAVAGTTSPGRAVADGGLMIDLSEMKRIAVDPAGATAVAEGGVTWGELNEAAAAHGLAVTGGAVSGTGIAGYTLGGGLGWLMAKFGLAVGQPARRRAGHRRGRRPPRRRGIAPRSVLGTSRRGRQLRRRDGVHLPAAPGGDGRRRPDRPPDLCRRRPAPLLPGRRRRRLGRPDRVRRARPRAGRLGRRSSPHSSSSTPDRRRRRSESSSRSRPGALPWRSTSGRCRTR